MKTKWKLTGEDVVKIITLYKENVSQNQIAKILHVDHSTIYYHLRKHDVELRVRAVNMKPRIRVARTFLDESGDVLNTGKSYKQYLEDEKRRNQKASITMIKSNEVHIPVDFTKYFNKSSTS